MNSVDGVATFAGLVITSPGNFSFAANSTGLIDDATVEVLEILPLLLTSLNISMPIESPSAYFTFDIIVGLYDQEENYFLSPNTVVLTSDSFTESLSIVTTTGLASFSMYLPNAGPVTVTATCDILSESLNFTVLPDSLKIISISPTVIFTQPQYTGDVFGVSVGVYDNAGENLESDNGSYNISLAISPLGTLVWGGPALAVGGLVNFSNVAILDPGEFYIIAEADEALEGKSEFSLIIATPPLVLSSIEIECDMDFPTANFEIKLIVVLKDQNGDIWKENCNVAIYSETEVYGEVVVESDLGYAEFEIVSKMAGDIVVYANTTTGLSNSTGITIYPFTIKYEISSFIVIFI